MSGRNPQKRQHLQASDAVPQETDGILQETLVYIQQKGGSTTRIQCLPDGYVVEGDLVSTEENLTETSPAQLLYVGYEEQYCSTYRVTGLPRTIPMGVASTLPSS